ncbi:MAG: hypothetical protein ACFE95_20360 [Candidatus Hodarchaeota archaeon]
MKTIQLENKEFTTRNLRIHENDLIKNPLKWKISLILISWLTFLSLDLLFHAGILATLYVQPNPAILDPEQAFFRIPIGYLSFLLSVIVFYWLFSFTGVNEWKNGFIFGLKYSVLIAVASTLAQYSILKVNLVMLIGWGVAQIMEFSMIGGIIGAAHSGISLKKICLGVVILVVITIIYVIILQNVGLAPPMEIIE